MSIPHPITITSWISPGYWRVAMAGNTKITKCMRIFAIRVLAPMLSRSGRIRPRGITHMAARYAETRGRETITDRRIYQLLAALADAGVLTRDGRPAPGRAATYRALIDGQAPRPMITRRRGILGKRIHTSFARELADQEGPAP